MWSAFITGFANKSTELIEEKDNEIKKNMELQLKDMYASRKEAMSKAETRRDELRKAAAQLRSFGLDDNGIIDVLSSGNYENITKLLQNEAKSGTLTQQKINRFIGKSESKMPPDLEAFFNKATELAAPTGTKPLSTEARGAFGFRSRAAEETTERFLKAQNLSREDIQKSTLADMPMTGRAFDYSALAEEKEIKAPTTEQLKANMGDLVAKADGDTYKERLMNALGTEQGAILWKRLQDRNATSDLISPKAKSESVSAKEQQIADLVEIGVPREYSVKLAYGLVQVFADAELANVVIVDKTTGTQQEVPFGQAPLGLQRLATGATAASQNQLGIDISREDEKAIQEVTKGKTLWQASDLGTGAWSTARSTLSRISGQFGGPQATETEGARSALRIYARDLARAIVENPRMPVALFQSALDDAATVPGTFDTPELMKERLRVLDGFLRNRLQQAERDSDDRSLPKTTRRDQAANAATLRNFIPKLGVPRGGKTAKDSPPQGITQREWDAMTETEKNLFRR